MRHPPLAIALLVAAPLAADAQAFDFESTAFGSYASLTITNAGQTLTVTPAAGFVTIDWEVASSTLAVSAVPEPTTVTLVAGGLLALAGVARRRHAA